MAELLSWHRVGRQVVCVDASANDATGYDWSGLASCPLVEGQIYTIVRVEVYADLIGFQLDEAPPAEIDLANYWRSTRFRPVRETSIESLRTLLNPVPEQARELEREAVDA